MSDDQLYQRILRLPENLKTEAADFVAFLVHKYNLSKPLKERQSGVGKDSFDGSVGINDSMKKFKG